MKRELKGMMGCLTHPALCPIARPIPMKRELKVQVERLQVVLKGNRKAHPDEKGTERAISRNPSIIRMENRKAHPDEKGTER